jgi:HTH-type transcriptional regulator/antitoxin HigA
MINMTVGPSNMAQSNSKSPNPGIRVIRSRADYDAMRHELDRLLDLDPQRGSPERDRLDVLLVLLADYEARQTAPPVVDPVDAIMFRLDQLGLKPRDLEPYLGGRSRVSEVLGRKRPLSIAMIRALHDGLGIPAEALINPAEPPEEESLSNTIPWERFPIREMVSRGWIAADRTRSWTRDSARKLLEPFFADFGTELISAPLFRHSAHFRSAKEMDEFALAAWNARVIHVAHQQRTNRPFAVHNFGQDQIQGLVQLSRLDEGPRLAREWFADRGVVVVIVPHLARTRLDGAAMVLRKGLRIIALTLRYDRLDNFWFTLLHECAHIVKHLSHTSADEIATYYDDLDIDANDPREREADEFARESLVPSSKWQASAVAFAPSVEAAVALADDIGVSPSVVAGRVRHEKRNFRLLGPLVGLNQVRKLFPEAHFD